MKNDNAVMLNAEWAAATLPPRPQNAHKGTFGTLGILAGCSLYRGAAALSAAGALRAGCGIVRVASIEKVCAAVAAHLPSAILLPLAETTTGGIAPQGAAQLAGLAHSTILAGCGLGNTADTTALLVQLLSNALCPLVLDADALNAIAASPALHKKLGSYPKPVVLTPHLGEMARLCGKDAADIAADQTGAATRYAAESGCVVVLKSHCTVVASPWGEVFQSGSKGNAGLAKGGSGDVLAGIIASLLAQGLPPAHAAAAGVYLHAAAGGVAAQKYGQDAMNPADLPLCLSEVFKSLGRA